MLGFSGCEGGTVATVPIAATVRNHLSRYYSAAWAVAFVSPAPINLSIVIGRCGSPAGRVKDRVGDGGGRADDADLAQALHADRARLVVCSSTKITSISWMSAFAGMWYSAKLWFMKRPRLWSVKVSS